MFIVMAVASCGICAARVNAASLVSYSYLLPAPEEAPTSSSEGSVITATLTANTPTLTVGDPITLTISVIHPTGSRVVSSPLPDTWGDLEVRAQQLPQTTANDDGTQTTTQTVAGTLWAPGSYMTPPLTLTVAYANGELAEVTAAAIPLTVRSVLTEDDLSLRDIKPQASLDPAPIWPWLLGGLLGVLLLAAVGYWARQRWSQRVRGTAVPALPIDTRPPHEIALAELLHITTLNLPAQGHFKEHYTLVTDTLRRYLENAFDVSALDKTTGEIRRYLRQTHVFPEMQAQLLSLLTEADLVKFAKVTPELPAAQELPQLARQFVLATADTQEATGGQSASPSPAANGGGQ